MSDGEKLTEVLALFVESGELPSATRERRRVRALQRERERNALQKLNHAERREQQRAYSRRYYAERAARRPPPPITPLPPVCSCVFCGLTFTDAHSLYPHRAHCYAIRSQAAE